MSEKHAMPTMLTEQGRIFEDWGKNLPAAAMLVLFYLGTLAEHTNGEDHYYIYKEKVPKQEDLAKELGCGRSKISAGFVWLKGHGILQDCGKSWLIPEKPILWKLMPANKLPQLLEYVQDNQSHTYILEIYSALNTFRSTQKSAGRYLSITEMMLMFGHADHDAKVRAGYVNALAVLSECKFCKIRYKKEYAEGIGEWLTWQMTDQLPNEIPTYHAMTAKLHKVKEDDIRALLEETQEEN